MSRKNPRRGARARNRAGAGSENPALLWQTAVAAYQQGDPVRARRALKPLLDHPAADGTTFLLGGTLEAQLDNMPRAAQLLEKAVRMSPDSAEAWMSLGNVQHALGRMEEAARAYREAARLAPGNAQVWNNLGVVSEDVGLTRDALDYYDRALAIEPALASALRRRAPVLGRLRWFDPAREAYLDLIERFPDDPTLRLDYAQFLEQANRPDEAAHYLPESDQLADHADRARAEYLRAQLLIREGNLDMALERVRAAQARTGQEFLCYREGVILDRLGRYDEAMEAFQRANRATAKQKDFRRLLAQPLDEYLGGKLEAGVLAPDPADPATATRERTPVFVTGLPRSGTTLLDRMLAAHPDIQVLEELEALHVAEEALDAGATPAQARQRYWEFVGRHVELRPDAVVVDKNPIHVMHLDVLPRLFPDARVILVLRHPYDAALSCYMQDFDPGPVTARFLDLDTTASVCARFLRLMLSYEAARPQGTMRVRYEDLVADFQHQVKRVLQLMELDWHAGIEDYAEIAARAAPIMTASYEQVTRKVYNTSLERWKHYEKWLAPFHDALGPLLDELNYRR